MCAASIAAITVQGHAISTSTLMKFRSICGVCAVRRRRMFEREADHGWLEAEQASGTSGGMYHDMVIGVPSTMRYQRPD